MGYRADILKNNAVHYLKKFGYFQTINTFVLVWSLFKNLDCGFVDGDSLLSGHKTSVSEQKHLKF